MIVAFLQNAWSPFYAGGTWPREHWLRALHRSRSGQRLAVLTKAAGLEIWFDNTTPIVGTEPSSIVEPDPKHIQDVIASTEATSIIAMGKQAAEAVRPFLGPRAMLIVPHPAYRCLTNALYEKAGGLVAEGFSGILELKQGRGLIQTVNHDVQC